MSSSQACDLLVVGGGVAGLVAAARAAELGLDVVVLERGAEEDYACNSRLAIGVFHVAFQDVMAAPDVLSRAIQTVTGGYASPAQRDAIAGDAGRAVRWLRDHAVRFVKAAPYEWMSWVLAPPVPLRPGLHWQGRGADVLLRTLAGALAARNGRLLRDTRADSLLMTDGRCVGVQAISRGTPLRFTASAVIVADGGFQGNPDMVRQHLSPQPDRLLQRGAGTGVGDGARMAAAVGAKLVGMDQFYGHVQCRDALENPGLWPYPILDVLVASGIVVDGNGNRFADEGRGGVYMANAIARLAEPLGSVLVFDHATWTGPGREYIMPPNPNVVTAGGRVSEAPDLASLAARLELPAAALQRTVQGFNEALRAGKLGDLTPPRTSRVYTPYAVERPPYYAISLCAGLTYTMGGLAIDGHGRVLGLDDQPVPGLFAAGSTTGGLEGGDYAGYVGGLVKAVVFGLRAAECITALQQRPRDRG